MTVQASPRPVCVYASGGLKRNATKLTVVMCIGLALALYGLYVQSRTHANSHYTPNIAVATNWFYHNIGQHIVHPSSLLGGCHTTGGRQSSAFVKPSMRHAFTYRMVNPITRYSGFLNGLINLVQIIVLKVCATSLRGSDAIAGLSILGLAISMICLVGSFATCKLMCISCLGIHHIVIIYLALRRRKILQTLLCPASNVNGNAACTYGGPAASASNSSSAGASGQQQQTLGPNAGKHTSTCVTRRNGGGGSGTSSDREQSRRRSNRL